MENLSSVLEEGTPKPKLGFHVQNLTWKGGYLGQFDLHQEKTSAFVGDVSFDRITLPRTDEHHRIQWLRDAREALNARSNFVAAGIFHASELKLTRPKGWRKFFSAYWWTSLVYQAGSDFGNSIGRPLAWFIGTMLSLAALSYAFGTRVARKDHELHGWQIALNGDELLRAAQYAMQSINPLNLFGSPLVVMSHKWGAIAGGFLGIIGIAAFALLFARALGGDSNLSNPSGVERHRGLIHEQAHGGIAEPAVPFQPRPIAALHGDHAAADQNHRDDVDLPDNFGVGPCNDAEVERVLDVEPRQLTPDRCQHRISRCHGALADAVRCQRSCRPRPPAVHHHHRRRDQVGGRVIAAQPAGFLAAMAVTKTKDYVVEPVVVEIIST